jgi:hypothetical protein
MRWKRDSLEGKRSMESRRKGILITRGEFALGEKPFRRVVEE